MRKPIPKSVRKLVYAKYDGHCAYCGCKIPEKGFNVDHLYCLRNYEYTEDFTGIDVHDIKNFMPACGSCNRYKATMDLEEFRKQLQKIPDRLARLESELSNVQSKKTKAIEALSKMHIEHQKLDGGNKGNDVVRMWAEKVLQNRRDSDG